MKEEGLFSSEELKALSMPPLTEAQRIAIARQVISDAKNTVHYMYDVEEVGLMLRKTKDEMKTLLDFYRLDSINVRTSVRIPWWSLAEYLIDPATDVDRMFYKWLKSLPHKPVQ